MTELTLKVILQMAIEKEIDAQKMYSDLEKRMTDDVARDAFHELVQQEHGHQLLLEDYQRGEIKSGALKAEQLIDYKIVEASEYGVITPEMPLKDIFLLAANREKLAHEGYLSLSRAHPAGEAKTLLEDLASQELEHKHRLEYLFTEVAFPQTDGG